jgi:hypothetical protein
LGTISSDLHEPTSTQLLKRFRDDGMTPMRLLLVKFPRHGVEQLIQPLADLFVQPAGFRRHNFIMPDPGGISGAATTQASPIQD